MKFFKNKKLMIILSCAILVCVVLSVILYFSLAKTTDEKNEPDVKPNFEIADTQTDKNQINENTQEKSYVPDINDGNGPVNIHGGDDLVEKIDKFNSLNDDDPEKEKIRKELEDLFEYAQGTTLN